MKAVDPFTPAFVLPQPAPIHWTVGKTGDHGAKDEHGRPLVLLRFETVHGPLFFHLPKEQAKDMGAQLADRADKITGLTIAKDIPPRGQAR